MLRNGLVTKQGFLLLTLQVLKECQQKWVGSQDKRSGRYNVLQWMCERSWPQWHADITVSYWYQNKKEGGNWNLFSILWTYAMSMAGFCTTGC